MTGLVVRRVAQIVPLLLLLSVIAFFVANLAPSDPALIVLQHQQDTPPTTAQIAAERHLLHLDDPLVSRYLRWVGHAATGDLGRSYGGAPVAPTLGRRFLATLQLALAALALGVLMALPLGMLSALWRGRALDHLARVVSLVGASMPSFWLGYLLIIGFSVHFHLFPAAGRGGWRHLALPATTLAVGTGTALGRLLRSDLVHAMGEPYARTATAKGASRAAVMWAHALPNSLTSVLNVAGIRFGYLLAGTAIVETVFAWPGVGTYVLQAIHDRDYPVIQGFVLLTGALFILVNLVVDLTQLAIDPRVRLSGGRS
jgi:ABC-type dipeptide/oligopeptide/nickel transport system permease component